MPNWRKVMSNELTALMRRGTWNLVPPQLVADLSVVSGFFVLNGNQMTQLIASKLNLLPKAITNALGLIIKKLLVPL
jgi:hypothetical protein